MQVLLSVARLRGEIMGSWDESQFPQSQKYTQLLREMFQGCISLNIEILRHKIQKKNKNFSSVYYQVILSPLDSLDTPLRIAAPYSIKM